MTIQTAGQVLLATMLGIPHAIWGAPTPADEVQGYATYYRPGLMEEVAVNRQLDLTDYLAGVALNRAGDLGRTVWIQFDDGGVYGPFLVVDCAQRGAHFELRERQGYVVEVPAWVARLQGFYGVGPASVRVLFRSPYPVGKELLSDRIL